jgi:hypothetical protein
MTDHADIDHTGLTGVGGSVATDAIWDAAGDLAVGSGANTAAKLTKGSALDVLRVNAGGTALEWAAPSGGSSTYDPDATPASDNAVSNEFDGGGGGTYTWTTTPGSSDEDTTYPGHLYVLSNANQAGTYYYYRAAYTPGATDFTAVMKLEAGFSHNASIVYQLGIALLDSSDAVIWRAMMLDDTGNDGALAYRWNDTNAGTVTTAIGYGAPVWLMIQRTSGNVYTGLWSANGKTWIRAGSSTVATTVAKVGISVLSAGTEVKHFVTDYIRVFDSITRLIGA